MIMNMDITYYIKMVSSVTESLVGLNYRGKPGDSIISYTAQ